MISIIVPVYNAEAYLEKCLDCLAAQTYSEFEVILVDDGSKDGSHEICDKWSAKDNRFRVIHQENGGAARARNVGLSEAKGEYIGFVDSDDVFEPQLFQTLLEVLKKTDADIVECDYDKFEDYSAVKHQDCAEFSTKIFEGEDLMREYLRDRRFRHVIWNKIYKREIACNVRFPEGIICEDENWTFGVAVAAKRFVHIDAVLYHYYQSVNSVMRQAYSKKRLVCIDAFEERIPYMRKNYPVLYSMANNAFLHACFFHYQQICGHAEIDQDFKLRDDLFRRFKQGDWHTLLASQSWKYRVWYRLFMLFPLLTCRLRNRFHIGDI